MSDIEKQRTFLFGYYRKNGREIKRRIEIIEKALKDQAQLLRRKNQFETEERI